MQEREVYKQDFLPECNKRKRAKDFASVFVQTEVDIKVPMDDGRLAWTTERVLKKIEIPRKDILYKDLDDGVIVAKVKNEQGDEKITTFLKTNDHYFDEYFDKRNKLFLSGEGYFPGYLVTRFWSEEPEMKFSPWNTESLKVLEGKDLEAAGVDEIGGKTTGLVRLKKYEDVGFEVPDFFVIPTSFYRKLNIFSFGMRAEEIMKSYNSAEDIMRENNFGSLDTYKIPDGISELFDSLGFESSPYWRVIKQKIINFSRTDIFGEYFSQKIKLRSSSPLEDGNRYQFQGVFNSQTVDDTRGLYEAFKQIYLSPWSSYAEFYFRNRNLIGKVDRDLAVIVQKQPDDPKIICRASFKNGRVVVEGVLNDERSWLGGNYFGVRTVVDEKGKIIENEWVKGFIDKEVVGLAKVLKKLSKKYPEYNRNFNVEALLGGSKLYLVQIRPTIEMVHEGEIPDMDQIDDDRTFAEVHFKATNFSIGKVEGPVVNLTGYRIPTGDREFRYENVDDFFEKAALLDKEYPGAVFIVDMDYGDGTLINEEFHMITSHKGGIVTCDKGRLIYDVVHSPHFYQEFCNDPCFHVLEADQESIIELKTGQIIGIVSNGNIAKFYYPDNYKKPEIIFSRPKKLDECITYYSQLKLPIK